MGMIQIISIWNSHCEGQWFEEVAIIIPRKLSLQQWSPGEVPGSGATLFGKDGGIAATGTGGGVAPGRGVTAAATQYMCCQVYFV